MDEARRRREAMRSVMQAMRANPLFAPIIDRILRDILRQERKKRSLLRHQRKWLARKTQRKPRRRIARHR